METKRVYKTIWEEVAIDLKNRILIGDIKQGERIKETEIAEQFGISRGPIREAFRQLEKEGLIEYSSRKGCTVKTISAKDASEYYLLRANLENFAVRMVRGRFSEDTILRMKDIVKEMEQYQSAESLPQIIDSDQRFHENIVKECEMEKLVEMWSTLDNANAIIFYALYHTRYSPNGLFSHNHDLIINALETADVETICNCLQEHYLIVSKNLYRTEEKEAEFTDEDIRL